MKIFDKFLKFRLLYSKDFFFIFSAEKNFSYHKKYFLELFKRVKVAKYVKFAYLDIFENKVRFLIAV